MAMIRRILDRINAINDSFFKKKMAMMPKPGKNHTKVKGRRPEGRGAVDSIMLMAMIMKDPEWERVGHLIRCERSIWPRHSADTGLDC